MRAIPEHQRGDYLMSSIDHTPVMVAKLAPAAVGTGVSLSETAQEVIAFADIPWAEVAAFLTCLYTFFLLCDWFWKKYKAIRSWWQDRELI